MKVSEINTLLNSNPYFRNLSDKTRLSIYNQVLEEIEALQMPVYLNYPVQDTPLYVTAFLYDLKALGLSEIGSIDSRLMEYQFISDLDQASRLLIYTLASQEIAEWCFFYGKQDYLYSTVIPDYQVYQPENLKPGLKFSSMFLRITQEIQALVPEINLNALVLRLIKQSNTLVTEIQLLTQIIKAYETESKLIAPIQMAYGIDYMLQLESMLLSAPISMSYTFTPYDLLQSHKLKPEIIMQYRIPSAEFFIYSIMSSPIGLQITVIDEYDSSESQTLNSPILMEYKIE